MTNTQSLNPKLITNIPVIAVTTFASKKERLTFSKVGFDGLFQKPIDAKSFRDELNEILH